MDMDLPIPLILAEYADEYKKARDSVVKTVLAAPDRVEEIWQAIEGAPNARIRLSALSALDYVTRKSPALAQPFADRLLALDLTALDDGPARHFANILGKLELGTDSREQVLQKLYDLYQSDRAVAIRVFALQSLFDLMKTDQEGRQRLRNLLGFAADATRPAMRSRGRNLLNELDKLEKA